MKKIFFIIWADPKFYHTLIFLSQKLSKNNNKVYILQRNVPKNKEIIKKTNFGKKVKILKYPKFFTSLNNFLEYIIFNFYLLYRYLEKKPDTVIFFNQKGLLTSLILRKYNRNIQFIYHNFDFENINRNLGLFKKLLINLELFCSKLCDYLVFPSVERAKIFKKISNNSKSKYFSFMNCFPKKYFQTESDKFYSFLTKKKFLKKKVICHLGSIGPNHYLEEVIKSFQYTNNNTILVIAGLSISSYALKLKLLINQLSLKNKVFIFEGISNDYWFNILRNSSIGVCFYKDISISHRHMAGTSNKFNNYLSSNLPMLVNNNKDFRLFKKSYDIYELTNPKSPKKIAISIEKLLKNRKRYQIIKKNMKKAYKSNLNFDLQFEKSYGKIL